jgi:hypothetical protein
VLSGDVHHSYAARLHLPPGWAPVWQLVCSPFRNPLPRQLRIASALVFTRPARAIARQLAWSAGARRPRPRWGIARGPWFDNMITTLDIDGRAVRATWERALASDELDERGHLSVGTGTSQETGRKG